MNTFAEIIRKTAMNFKKFKTNISEINTRKIEKIYCCYEIPADEKIIAFCKTHFLGITINGCVFTDKAFYPRPVILNSAPSKGDLVPARIAYFDFGKYLIIQSDEKDAVFMRSKEKNYFITFSTLTSINVTGCEIRKTLLAIQQHLCENIPEAKQTIKDIAEEYFKRACNEIKNGNISLELRDLLKGMIIANCFRTEALELLSEGIYRLCNEAEYFSLISKYSDLMSKEKHECYINIPQKFKDNLIADLSNPNLTFSADYMNLIRYNLGKARETEENQKYYIFACIRAGKIIEARLKINNLIKCFGRETAFIAEDFACFYGNQKMQNVVGMMKDNQDMPEKLYNITDALGFTPLHYAIILNYNDTVRKLSGNKKLCKNTEYVQSEKIKNLLSYTTVAFLQNMTLLACIISNTSSEMIQFSLQRKTLKKQIKKANNMIEYLIRESEKLRRKYNAKFIKDIFHGNFNLDDTPEDEEYYQNQRILSDSIQKLKDLCWNTQREIENLESLARETYQAIINQISQTVSTLKNDKSPFVKLFISLYKNDAQTIPFNMQTDSENSITISNDTDIHILLKILEMANTTSHFRIYDYDGFFFMLPDCIELNMPHRKIHITDNGIVDSFADSTTSYRCRNPKYGNSWFSEAAHNDMQVLKQEYRHLAKKYHPDVCADADASGNFAAIQNEYEKIFNSK